MPALRYNIGSILSVSGTASIYNNATIQAGTDALVIDNTVNNALLADFYLSCAVSGASMSGGGFVLACLDWDLGAVNGPSFPLAGIIPIYAGTFDRIPVLQNGGTIRTRVNSVPLKNKSSYFIYNMGTGGVIATPWTLFAQCWSPG